MTLQQFLAFAVLAGAILLFAWGRIRYDLVALGSLLVGCLVGVVRPGHAFTGFTSDVVIIIAAALVISAAFARSGIVDRFVGPFSSRLKTVRTQVPALASATAFLSMLTKNVGALAIMMPIAQRIARRTGTSASSLLMPMSFMSLLGGLVTLVGTSTNIIVSQIRQETAGAPFHMFDFAPVGLALTAIGIVFVSFGYRLLPKGRLAGGGLQEVLTEARFSVEARVPQDWPEALATLEDLKLQSNGVRATALIRGNAHVAAPSDDESLAPGVTLVLEGDEESIDQVFSRLPLLRSKFADANAAPGAIEESRSVEAVIEPNSPLIGTTIRQLRLQHEHGISVLGVRRSNGTIRERLRQVTLRAGDVLAVQAGEGRLAQAMCDLGLLPLVERPLRLARIRRRYLPPVILAASILLIAFGAVPVAIGFFGAAVLIVLTGGLSMRQAYGALEPEVLVLIGALTPISEAVRETGGTDLIASALAHLLSGAPGLIALGLIMLVSMLCSPFLHNAPTVLVLAPIGASLGHRLGLNSDAFLMAVATGAGCDFLTPIGHQCNTLVMRPGGYRFGDYWRLGLPLSVLVIVAGTPLIASVWSLWR